MNSINNTFLMLSKRAETYDREHLIRTFVNVGPLFTILSNKDHEILYGRRGTGKTHALAFLSDSISKAGDIVVNIDLRTIGSNGGIFGDTSIPITERATRLLIDTISFIQDGIIFKVIEESEERFDLSILSPIADSLAESISQIRITGEVGVSETQTGKSKVDEKNGLELGVSTKSVGIKASFDEKHSFENGLESQVHRKGIEVHRINFSSVYSNLAELCAKIGVHVWIIFDEWAEIPIDLQPFLAEMIRRTILPNRNITVKIAAIEQRTCLATIDAGGNRIGIELGADIAASQNLDEYMVFDNDENKAKDFFETLIYQHFISIVDPKVQNTIKINSSTLLLSHAFTQINAFFEFVRASEGVPRDGINILGIAAMKAGDGKISIEDIRSAARTWFTRGKEKAISSNENALHLLRWIIDEVIGKRNARAFLLRSNIKEPLIDYLFDSRILHVIKENVSGKDEPGVRYNVYSIDYGCYVDLINTSNAPKGLFEVIEEDDDKSVYINVPKNDYRAIRRAILNLDNFKKMMEEMHNK